VKVGLDGSHLKDTAVHFKMWRTTVIAVVKGYAAGCGQAGGQRSDRQFRAGMRSRAHDP